MRDRAARESHGLPERMEGWSWASVADVDSAEWLDFPDLDAVVAEAAAQTGTASLGFAVMDSDSVYLVGADQGAVRFRVVVNEDAFEDEVPEQDVEGAAAWVAEHAPLSPSADDLRQVLGREFVFAEDGLDVLFARMGLLPAEVEQAVSDAEDEDERLEAEEAARVAALDDVADLRADADRPLEEDRWYAAVRGFRGREDETWFLLVAEGPLQPTAAAFGLQRELARFLAGIAESGGWRSTVAFLCKRGEDVRMLDPIFDDRDDLERELRGPGFNLDVGEWDRVPDDVPRDLAATASWVSSPRGTRS